MHNNEWLPTGTWQNVTLLSPTYEGSFANKPVIGLETCGTFAPGFAGYVHKQGGFGLVER